LVYIIKDLNKKKIQERAVEEMIERATSGYREKPKYDEVMEKAIANQEKMKERLKDMGIDGVMKMELRRREDLSKVASPISEQGSVALDKSKLRDSFVDVQVNPDNFNDVRVGGIKKR